MIRAVGDSAELSRFTDGLMRSTAPAGMEEVADVVHIVPRYSGNQSLPPGARLLELAAGRYRSITCRTTPDAASPQRTAWVIVARPCLPQLFTLSVCGSFP